jgi:serine protease Do
MKRRLIPVLVTATLLAAAWPAWAQSLAQVFKRASPATVVVRTRGQEVDVTAEGRSTLAGVSGVGSGVLIAADGKVMTAAHVVQLVDEVTVEFLDGSAVPARVIASEPEADVSLLQLESVPENAVVARLANSDKVEIGDPAFIIGAPYGLGHTLSVGHITGRHQPHTIFGELGKAEFLQTDAAINTGNSGGPMFNLAGEVIGIVSHIISKSGGFEGLGFVVSSNMARTLLLEQRAFWTGLSGFFLQGDLAKVFNLPQPTGLLVQRVAANSAAARLGIRGGTMKLTIEGITLTVGGDILLESVGIPIVDEESRNEIRARLSQLEPGSPISVKVLREGKVVELTGQM